MSFIDDLSLVPLEEIFDGNIEDRMAGERVTSVIWNNIVQTLRTHTNWIIPYLRRAAHFRGAWNINKDYDKNAIVYHEDNTYIALQDINADDHIDIGNTEYWYKLTVKGDKGDPGEPGTPGARGPEVIWVGPNQPPNDDYTVWFDTDDPGNPWTIDGNHLDISENESITNIIDGTTPVAIPIASDETLGGVKVGSGLNITEDGTLSASGGGGSSELEITHTQTGYVDVTLDDDDASVVRVNYKFVEISEGLIYLYYTAVLPDISGKHVGANTSSIIIPAWAIPTDNNVPLIIDMTPLPAYVTELTTNENAGWLLVRLPFTDTSNYPRFIVNKNAWAIPEGGTPESQRTYSGMLSYYTI